MPLKVAVVGAGLAGLGAAIAMNREGHDVEVFEQSSFLHEVGAAIHIPPNATRILKEWGFSPDDLDPVYCKHLTTNSPAGKTLVKVADTKQLQQDLQTNDEWLLTHRVDLHNALRRKAEEGSEGKKPKIHLSSKIESVDPDEGIIYLENGRTHMTDLIIGADGSKTVAAVTEKPQGRVSTGQNCFRFLVPVDKIKANPITRRFFTEEHVLDGLHCFASEDRRLVVYPCRHGTSLNIGAIYPTGEDDTVPESSWLSGGKLEELLNTFSSFCPELIEMCRMAEDLKLWSLASRTPPSTFYKGCLVLVGDAAHPTLPHQGQGGAQSFEDGAVLGALFPRNTTKAQIPERLAMYEQLRYPRSVTVMYMSKVAYEKRRDMMDELHRYVPNAEYPEDLFKYFWGAYPGRDAKELLAQSSATRHML
ncbi:hypothetical protein F25303_14365 [Fusarium sp. NRRL 25303]|nr:hypothetical protein F25303_14365 [Fusarium sp. NRRL 25303]